MQVEVLNEASRVVGRDGVRLVYDRWVVRVTHVDGRVERFRCADQAEANRKRDSYFA